MTWRDITPQVDLEREVIASSEREKTRIGHDLHDGLAQLLIGVKLMLEALKEKLAASGSRYSGDAERAASLVRRAISQTGDIAQGLSPIRKRGRLSDALHQLGRHSEDLLGVPCHVTSSDLPRRFSENSGHASLPHCAGGDHERRETRQGYAHRDRVATPTRTASC